MSFYIKEWPDNTATLMTEGGRVVWIFPSVEEAEEAAENCGEIANAKKIKLEKKEFSIKAVA
jgi:hypothetical protein